MARWPKGTFKNGATCPRDLVVCARIVPELLDARHDADYDPTARFEHREVFLLLGKAGVVLQTLRDARSRSRPELQLFLLQCAGAKR